jgi:hypothetical protein
MLIIAGRFFTATTVVESMQRLDIGRELSGTGRSIRHNAGMPNSRNQDWRVSEVRAGQALALAHPQQ